MPKTSTVTPVFSPFTFDEILKPLEQYKKSYDETQEKLDKIADDAGALQYIADSLSEDNPLKVTYNTYIQNLQRAADGMAQGLSLDTAKITADLRRQYSSVLTPLNTAKSTLSEWQKNQREAKAKDDSIIFSHDVNDDDILDFITRNPSASYQTASADNVRTRVAQAVASLQNQYRSSIMGTPEAAWKDTAEGRLLSKDLSTGLTLDDIETILTNPSLFPEIHNIIDEAYNSSGIEDWGTNDQKDYIRQAAITGLMGGIGKSDEKIVNNPNHVSPLERSQNALGWAKYYASLGLKADGKTPMTEDEKIAAGIIKAPSGGSSNKKQENRTNQGIVSISPDGTVQSFESDKAYRDSKLGNGKLVTKASDISAQNQEYLKDVLGFYDSDAIEDVLSYAKEQGIIISVDGSANGSQRLIIHDRGTQSKIKPQDNIDEDFDPNNI